MKFMLSVFLFILSVTVFAQRETFDVATYTIPDGWKKTNITKDVVNLVVTNSSKGTYCQIGIYASTNSKGKLQADFESEWQELVVKQYKPKTDPELIPSESENGWDAKGGVAPFEFNGTQSAAMLLTMTSKGRCMSIVVLTNTSDYEGAIQKFLESVDLQKIETPSQPANDPSPTVPGIKPAFTFNTTNFDDGWSSTEQADWVKVLKGNIKVLIHYPNKNADGYNPDLLDGLKNAWNILVAPKYSSVGNVEFKPISGWQSVEFAEADAVENVTGKSVHIVLFKKNFTGSRGNYIEFITPDKRTYEQEFGAYRQESSGWEKVEAMATYNKFAVGAGDLKGKWTSSFSGMTQYVNAYTGADAGATSHASSETFEFRGDNTYNWNIATAGGVVGNAKFQSAKSTGTLTFPNNWQIYFSDLEGKPKTFNIFFSSIKGARILWLENSAYPMGYTAYGKKE